MCQQNNNLSFSDKNISSYFLGIISINENNASQAYNFFKKIQPPQDQHINFNIQFLRSLVWVDKFDKSFNELAFKTAVGMSLISMVSMEIAMNATDYFLTGGAILTWWVVPIMLAVGFVTPWPYNYWRLKKFNEACH